MSILRGVGGWSLVVLVREVRLDLGGLRRLSGRGAPGNEQQRGPEQAGKDDGEAKHGRQGTVKQEITQLYIHIRSGLFQA